MEAFLRAIPEAAVSPLALTAYAIAAVLFLLAGQRITWGRSLLKRISDLPEDKKWDAFRLASGVVLPESITPEQWLRHSRQRAIFTLLGALIIAILAVVVIAITRSPDKAALEDLKNAQAYAVRTAERRLQYPLEDVEVHARLRLDNGNEHLAKYMAWLEDQYRLASDKRDCYDLRKNPLRIAFVTPATYPLADTVCQNRLPFVVPSFSPLFPGLGSNGPAAEILSRLMLVVALFEPATIANSNGPNENDGLLVMKAEATGTTEEPMRGLLIQFDPERRELYILAENFKFTREKWRRNPSITSMLDLAGKDMVVWTFVGKKEFYSAEVDTARRSLVLESLTFRMGGLRFRPSRWEARSVDGVATPVWISALPKREDELLGLFR